MAPDQRDRSFEKVLARHLRLHAMEPGEPGQAGTSHPPCPDAELLASYHERSLAPEQMTPFKQHIAGCGRCQEILATLESSDSLSVEVDQQAGAAQNVLTMPAPRVELPAEGVAQGAKRGPAPLPSRAARVAHSSWRSKTLRGANWRWLAPAGALAAALLVWVSFHETHPPQFELAKNNQQAVSAPSSSATSQPAAREPAAENESFARKEVPRSSADARVARSDAAASEEPRKNQRALRDEKKTSEQGAGKPTDIPSEAAPARSRAQAERAANQPALTAQAQPQNRAVTTDATRSAAAPQTSAPPKPAATPDETRKLAERDADSVNAVVTEAPPKAASSFKSKSVVSGRQAPQELDKQQAVGAVTPVESAPVVRVTKTRLGAVAIAPGSTVMWRLSPGGLIEHSSDAGATWAVQTSGVVAELLAGSAPSANVCWMVGRDATILRTTDGGAHWQKIPSPAADDLISVFAVSAQQATISTATTHKTYRTTDAGQTWSLVLNP
jgi:hypothetical protein